MPDLDKLTPEELNDLYHAQSMEDNLDKWEPQTKLEGRIHYDAKNLLRLAVRIVNSNHGDDRDDAVANLEEFLR